jgi:hypothetical protein
MKKPQQAAFHIWRALCRDAPVPCSTGTCGNGPGAIIRPVPGAHPCGARLWRFKIVPDNFVEPVTLRASARIPNQNTKYKKAAKKRLFVLSET